MERKSMALRLFCRLSFHLCTNLSYTTPLWLCLEENKAFNIFPPLPCFTSVLWFRTHSFLPPFCQTNAHSFSTHLLHLASLQKYCLNPCSLLGPLLLCTFCLMMLLLITIDQSLTGTKCSPYFRNPLSSAASDEVGSWLSIFYKWVNQVPIDTALVKLIWQCDSPNSHPNWRQRSCSWWHHHSASYKTRLASSYLIPRDRQLHEDRDRLILFNIVLLETNPGVSLQKPLRKQKFKD